MEDGGKGEGNIFRMHQPGHLSIRKRLTTLQ